MIRLAKNLTLPADIATQTTLILGKRGSGKTSTGVRLVEQLAKAKVPFVIIDPADAWWGLKASHDGRRAGLNVYVFGGRHRDAPLEPTGGKLIAEVLVEHRISMVLAIKEFSNRERARFVTDFCHELVRRNTDPLHVVLEEAHELAPQSDFRGSEEMLGAVKRLWKLGRSSGIGGSAITQRPAALHKDITTQAEILVVHRTIGPQDVAAVKAWIQFHGDRDDILAELGGLKTGEAFVWAPDFPESAPIGLIRTRILPRETFDSSATPKAGKRRREPKALRKVDLARLESKMAETIERERANDPVLLQRRVRDLERRLRESEARKPAPAPAPTKRVEVPVLKARQVSRLGAVARILERRVKAMEEATGVIRSVWQELSTALAAIGAPGDRPVARVAPTAPPPPAIDRAPKSGPIPAPGRRVAHPPGNGGITPARQRILNALAFLEGIGVGSAEKTQVALLAGASPRSGAFFNNLGGLRTAGLLDYPSAGRLALTEEGRSVASFDGVPSSTAELHQVLQRQLPPAKWRLLEVLITTYPQPLAKPELAERAGASATSGAYFNNLGSLRSLGLIDYPSSGQVIAQPVLFLEARA